MRQNILRKLGRGNHVDIFPIYTYICSSMREKIYVYTCKKWNKTGNITKIPCKFQKFFSIYIFSQFLVKILMIAL